MTDDAGALLADVALTGAPDETEEDSGFRRDVMLTVLPHLGRPGTPPS